MTDVRKNFTTQKGTTKKIPELKELTPDIIRETIEGIKKAIRENYVFPEQVEDFSKALEDHLANGDYDQVMDPKMLCELLTKHLREVVNDKHIQVLLPQDLPPIGAGQAKKSKEVVGLTRAEILPDNVGYLNITMFNPLYDAAERINGAMLYLKNTNALIVDLRKCRGGHGDTANFLLSYLFDSKFAKILLETYMRPQNLTVRNSTTWTPFKYTKPVYVLTSDFTFSGGEHFAYALKIHKKATIVGTNTGGGAHPVAIIGLDTGFMFKVPIGRTYDPETGKDWERIGIDPDISCPSDDALNEAQKDIRAKLITEKDGKDRKKVIDGPKKHPNE
ncbi:MAG: S41 family peptidase [Candidatus Odinarchaeota archaeon]